MIRILSWNCNGRFREKLKLIERLNCDIFVIQECENPQKYESSHYGKFAKNGLWISDNESKGLGIFISEKHKISSLDWPSYCLRCFLPVCIDETFDLVGVWTKKPYIEEFFVYQSINYDKINEDSILIGDFNSNAIWDKLHGERNHTAVVDKLSKKGLVSAYHYLSNECFGEEKTKSFYLWKKKNKGYHIDYCFVSPRRLKSFNFLDESFLNFSDHIPFIVEVL